VKVKSFKDELLVIKEKENKHIIYNSDCNQKTENNEANEANEPIEPNEAKDFNDNHDHDNTFDENESDSLFIENADKVTNIIQIFMNIKTSVLFEAKSLIFKEFDSLLLDIQESMMNESNKKNYM